MATLAAATPVTVLHGDAFKGLTEEEAEALGVALETLGNRAHRGFALIHSSALAAGNALANVTLPAVKAVRRALDEAAEAAARLGRSMAAIPATPGGPDRIEHRAFGGPVSAGSSYLVGERGPELFVPQQSGAIVPSGAGAGVRIDQLVINTHDPEEAADVFVSSMREKGVPVSI